MDKTIELVNSVKDIHAMPSVIVKALNIMKKPHKGVCILFFGIRKHIMKTAEAPHIMAQSLLLAVSNRRKQFS